VTNLSASNITIGKVDYRRISALRSRVGASQHLPAAGPSHTDLAWDGHAIIYENDEPLAESERFTSASKS
jgi:NAD+ synthase (glutamine-hydrolysing)